jgi:hypothetical protein
VSDYYAAQAMGLKVEAVEQLLADRNPFSSKLKACVYCGPLSTLVPRRFWSSAVDELASAIRIMDWELALVAIVSLIPSLFVDWQLVDGLWNKFQG